MVQMILKPIGVIHTPFSQSAGAPIQPCMAAGTKGVVEIFAEYTEGLKDLHGFDRVWLVYWCDRASEPRLSVKPYMDDAERGVFATRAPSRPNPIGLSNVRLLEVGKARLRVAELDILDGTPLLDVKPYVPRFDSYPVDRCGWLDKKEMKMLDRVTADGRFQRKKGVES